MHTQIETHCTVEPSGLHTEASRAVMCWATRANVATIHNCQGLSQTMAILVRVERKVIDPWRLLCQVRLLRAIEPPGLIRTCGNSSWAFKANVTMKMHEIHEPPGLIWTGAIKQKMFLNPFSQHKSTILLLKTHLVFWKIFITTCGQELEFQSS